MTLSYQTIYSRFLAKIQDYSFLSLSEDEASLSMAEWLHAACSKSYVRKLFDTFSLNDETESAAYKLYNSIDNDYDANFVAEVLVEGMMVEWLTPRVNSMEHVAQMFGGSEEKFYSQSSHLAEIKGLLRELQYNQRKLTRDFGYDYEVLSKREGT